MMKFMKIRAAALALPLALTACGGDDGPSSGGGGGTATPAPATPTPSPTPSPTATPAPSAGNRAFDAGSNFQGEIYAAEINVLDVQGTTAGQFEYGSSSAGVGAPDLDLQYRYTGPSADSMLALFGSEASYRGSEITDRDGDAFAYTATVTGDIQSDRLTVIPSAEADYVVLLRREVDRAETANGNPARRTFESYYVTGDPTALSAIPTGADREYDMTVVTSSPTRDGAGGFAADGNLTFGFANASFSGAMVLTQLGASGTAIILEVTVSGRIDRDDGTFQGTIRSADGAYSGAVVGSFYGPGAEQIGLVFALAHDGDPDVVGHGFGVS